jgi:hypothetical protein
METFELKLEAGVVATTNDGAKIREVITDYFHSVHPVVCHKHAVKQGYLSTEQN